MRGDTQAAEAERTRRHVLEYIAEHQDRHGWAPTVREIATAVGLASPASVQRHLQVLRDRGQLVLGNGPRMIRLTGGRIELREPVYGHRVITGDQRGFGSDGRLQPGRR